MSALERIMRYLLDNAIELPASARAYLAAHREEFFL